MAKRSLSRRISTERGDIPAADTPIIKELQARWTYAKQQKDPIIEEGRKDLAYLMGKTWETNELQSRKGRLSLEFDQLNQYRNQLVNSVREQPVSIKITPEGNGANDKTAQVRADRIRQIEYLSNAQECYTPAFEGATDRSYGYCRIVAEWEPKGFKKQLRIKPVPNPDQVLEDPDGMSITGRDWRYLFYSYSLSRDEFNRDYPNATFKEYAQLTDEDIKDAADWQGLNRVQLAEYWRVVMDTRTLLRLDTSQHGQQDQPFIDVYADDRTPDQRGLKVLATRDADVPTVCMYLTNGMELLAQKGKPKKTEWKGTTIPFIACYGPIVYTSNDLATASGTSGMVTARKQIKSYVRLARSAQKYYNYLKSSEGERFKMNLLVPYIGYEGQFSPEQLGLLQSSVKSPVPVVLVKPQLDATGTAVLPLPKREIAMLDVQGYEVAAEAARRDIQNALGRYSSSVGKADTNVRSGVLQEKLDKQSDQGSYHFVDGYKAMIAEVGTKLEELLPFYDDTAGTISTRTASGKVTMVSVNGHPDAQGMPGVMMDLGTHATTVSTGPSFDSQREEASNFADTLIGNQFIDRILGPDAAKQLLALAIQLKNVGPLGDEMAEIVSPQQDTDTKQLQAHLQQAMEQLKKQGAVLEEMHGIIQGKQYELEAAKYKTDSDANTRIKVAEIQFGSAVAVADIKADLAHSLQLMETQLQTVQGLIETHQAQLDRVQEAQSQLSAQQHATDTQSAAQDHATELAQTPPPVDPNAAPPNGNGAGA